MYKKDFVHYLAQRLGDTMWGTFGDTVSYATAEQVLNVVLSSIVEVVSTGDEVKVLPLGRFYPKLIRRRGKSTNVKMGFSTYPKLDALLTSKLSKKVGRILGDAQPLSPSS